jgi:hypothetical protein
LPGHGPIHHPPHLGEPPIGPLRPALPGQSPASPAGNTQFQLVHFILFDLIYVAHTSCSFRYAHHFTRVGWTKAVQPKNNFEKSLATHRAQKKPSNVPDKIPNPAFEGLGDPGQCFDRGLFLPPLNVTNVISGEISLFRQFLLAETGLLSLDANGLPQSSVDSARSRIHHRESKQNPKMELPTNSWYFFVLFCLPFPGLNEASLTIRLGKQQQW